MISQMLIKVMYLSLQENLFSNLLASKNTNIFESSVSDCVIEEVNWNSMKFIAFDLVTKVCNIVHIK